MAIEVGSILEGKITGITNFGAFVELGDKQTGLVHISEVAHEYVKDIKDILHVNDAVKVKVLGTDDKGKISLSIKQAQPKPSMPTQENRAPKRENRQPREGFESKPRGFENNRRGSFKSSGSSFEDKMSRFLKDSDERLTDLKRNTESKRGGRGGRRD